MKSKFPIYVRAIAIVMLFAMFHYMIGYRFVYSLGILYAKNEAKECMVKKTIDTKKLTLSASDYATLKWTEKGEEFSFNSEMYDVINIQKAGDTYIIKVYFDKTETGWVASLHNYEKEIFRPDQTAKGTKSADDIMASFQKDFAPSSEFKIQIFASYRLIQPIHFVQQQPFQVSNNIWHPPTIC